MTIRNPKSNVRLEINLMDEFNLIQSNLSPQVDTGEIFSGDNRFA